MSSLTAIDSFRAIGSKILRIKPFQYPSEWIAHNILIGPTMTGTGHTAPFNVWHFPWNVGIVDSWAEGKRGLLIKKAAQVGVSYYMQSLCLYFVARYGGPVAYAMAKDETVRKHVLDRIEINLRESPELVTLYLPGRDDHSTIRSARFLNATLEFFGSGSPLNFKSNPYVFAFCDEFEQMGVFPDGSDAVGLFKGRQAAYSTPFFAGWSTPLESESDRGIEVAVDRDSDMRLPYWRCPHCKRPITVNFLDNVRIEKDGSGRLDYRSARLLCPQCSEAITDSQRATAMIKAAQSACKWYTEEPFDPEVGWLTTLEPEEAARREYAGFDAIDHLANPRKRVTEIAAEYCSISSESEKKTFFNDVLGRGYTVKARQLSRDSIEDCMAAARREELPGDLLWITFGADLQHAGQDMLKSLFYYDISAWCWAVDPETSQRFIRKFTLFVDRVTSTEVDGHATIKTLLRSWTMNDRLGNPHRINMAVIDSTHRTKVVNAICNAMSPGGSQWCLPVIYGGHKTGDPDWQMLPQNEEVGDPGRMFLLTHRNYAVGTYVDMLTDERGLVELPPGIAEEVMSHYLANECVREADSHGIIQNKWRKKRDRNGRTMDDDYFAAGVYSMMAALVMGLDKQQATSISEAKAEADKIEHARLDALRHKSDSSAQRRARLSARLRRGRLTRAHR